MMNHVATCVAEKQNSSQHTHWMRTITTCNHYSVIMSSIKKLPWVARDQVALHIAASWWYLWNCTRNTIAIITCATGIVDLGPCPCREHQVSFFHSNRAPEQFPSERTTTNLKEHRDVNSLFKSSTLRNRAVTLSIHRLLHYKSTSQNSRLFV